MKIPAARGHQPQQATPVPAAYLAMAAAHMQSMGKPVVDPNAPPSQDQLAAAVKAPNATGN